jgi:hypothetical protein
MRLPAHTLAALEWAISHTGTACPQCKGPTKCSDCHNLQWERAAAGWIMEQANYLGLISMTWPQERFTINE